MIHVTGHAISRYQERVENLPEAKVREILSGPAFLVAVKNGARAVILGTGHRAVIKDGAVITVLTPHTKPEAHRDGGGSIEGERG